MPTQDNDEKGVQTLHTLGVVKDMLRILDDDEKGRQIVPTLQAGSLDWETDVMSKKRCFK